MSSSAPRADGAGGGSFAGEERAVHAGYATDSDAGRYAVKTRKGPVRRLSAAREAALVRRALRGLAPNATVLDMPCGAGRLLPVVGEAGRRATGADFSAPMLAVAAAAGAPLSRASAFVLPFATDAFEAVVCVRLLHHYREDARALILREIARVARERVVVTVFDRASHKHRRRERRAARRSRPSLRFGVDLDAFRGEMAAAGLEPVRTRRLLPFYAELTFVEARARPAIKRP